MSAVVNDGCFRHQLLERSGRAVGVEFVDEWADGAEGSFNSCLVAADGW